MRILFLILLLLMQLIAFADGYGRSRGGGLFGGDNRDNSSRLRSRTNKWWYETGSKSSRDNVHHSHARKSWQQPDRAMSRREAIERVRRSTDFQNLPSRFDREPSRR